MDGRRDEGRRERERERGGESDRTEGGEREKKIKPIIRPSFCSAASCKFRLMNVKCCNLASADKVTEKVAADPKVELEFRGMKDRIRFIFFSSLLSLNKLARLLFSGVNLFALITEYL